MFRESRGYFCEIALFTSHTVLKSTIRVLTLRVWPFLFLAAFWASVQTGIIQVDCKDANWFYSICLQDNFLACYHLLRPWQKRGLKHIEGVLGVRNPIMIFLNVERDNSRRFMASVFFLYQLQMDESYPKSIRIWLQILRDIQTRNCSLGPDARRNIFRGLSHPAGICSEGYQTPRKLFRVSDTLWKLDLRGLIPQQVSSRFACTLYI